MCYSCFPITQDKRGTETPWKTQIMLRGDSWVASMHSQVIHNLDSFVLELLIECWLLWSREEARVICQSIHLCCSSLQLRLFPSAYRSRKHCLSGSCGGMSTWVWLVSSGCPSVAASSSSWYLNCGSRALVVDDDEFSGAPGRSLFLGRPGVRAESHCESLCISATVDLWWLNCPEILKDWLDLQNGD